MLQQYRTVTLVTVQSFSTCIVGNTKVLNDTACVDVAFEPEGATLYSNNKLTFNLVPTVLQQVLQGINLSRTVSTDSLPT